MHIHNTKSTNKKKRSKQDKHKTHKNNLRKCKQTKHVFTDIDLSCSQRKLLIFIRYLCNTFYFNTFYFKKLRKFTKKC